MIEDHTAEEARVIASATDMLDGDRDAALLWYRHKPLVGFGGQTAYELVHAGHTDAVLVHLDRLRDGGYA